MANALKKRHVGHFCHPGEHGRVKKLLDIGWLCNYGTPREEISRIGQRLAKKDENPLGVPTKVRAWQKPL